MSQHEVVAEHYTSGRLLDRIVAGLAKIGKTPQTTSVDELAPVDEFHIGGRTASEDFVGPLGLSPSDHVLDVGCGFGGTSRFVASRFGCRVTGIDLTAEFVETGRVLCDWVQLGDRIDLQQGNALEMPFEESVFDAAIMLHVGMNIRDKARLFAQVARVVKNEAVFGVYDVMRTTDDPLIYPVPWASTAEASSLATLEEYRQALSQSGFEVIGTRDRRNFAIDFFEAARRRVESADGGPTLGVHVAMGENASIKLSNMVENIGAGRVSPVEIIARKAS